MLKSLAEVTVSGKTTECVVAPDVPLIASGKLPAVTVAGTDRTTVWLLPAATLNGNAGDVVAPAGNPESVRVTELVNPLRPVIDTAKLVLELPAVAVIAVGDRPMLKSLAEVTVSGKTTEWVVAPDVPPTASG